MGNLLTVLAAIVSPWVLLALAFLLYPEKVEKWWAIVLRVLTVIKASLHRRQVTHDLQGRVNDFVRRVAKSVPALASNKLRIEWVDPGEERKAFFDRDQVVLRMRRGDPEDVNFVHGCYLFVSETLLRTPKRYISPSQRAALDLFTCARILREERSRSWPVFLDEYLHPKTADSKSKVGGYLDDFAVIDDANLLFPLFVQELYYIGAKVFGRRKDAQIIIEVDDLIAFLKPIADRYVGDEGDLNYEGNYCRFAIVIIGKPAKLLHSVEPYIAYIKKQLVAKNMETIYLVAKAENRSKVMTIVSEFSAQYRHERTEEYGTVLKYKNREERVKQVLVVLRRLELPVVQRSA